MDLFTDAIRSLAIRDFRPGISERRSPWGTYYPANSWDVVFYAVRGKDCWLSVDGMADSIAVHNNSICIVPRGHAHALRDSLETTPAPLGQNRPEGYYGLMKYGGETGPSSLVYHGRFKVDPVGGHPFWDCLPPVIHVRCAELPSWLDTIFTWLQEELTARRLGYSAMVCRIAELLILQTIRLYIEQPGSPSALLGVLREPQLLKALEIIHTRGEQPWTLATLAAAVGTSRSRFAARFSAHLGQGPLHYLAKWRMHRAATLLRDTDLKIAVITDMIGYRSEPSFALSFRRQYGMTPGRYRATIRESGTTG